MLWPIKFFFTKQGWIPIISFHCKKANYLVHNNLNYPDEPIEQTEIFRSQQEKFIYVTDNVTILGSFPLMLLDYFGAKKLFSLLNNGK